MTELTERPVVMSNRGAGRLTSLIYEDTKERLVTGTMAAGSRVSVELIRERFGVSKQPVMEALRLLSSDGLVEILPQVGCEVAQYSMQEVSDFYDMFAGFEGAIAAAAAARRRESQLADLAVVSRGIDRLRSEPSPEVRATEYRLMNRAFHAAIHGMAGSRIMSTNSRRMWDLSDFLINTTGVPMPLSSATSARHEDHERIRQAIIDGDPVAARREMERHIVTTVDVIRHEAASNLASE
jgi:DNA-binding GntR family transcriptional regulator